MSPIIEPKNIMQNINMFQKNGTKSVFAIPALVSETSKKLAINPIKLETVSTPFAA